MKWLVVSLALMALAGCQEDIDPRAEAKAAESEYEFVLKNGGSRSDRCKAIQATLDAWQKVQDEYEYAIWQAKRMQQCEF